MRHTKNANRPVRFSASLFAEAVLPSIYGPDCVALLENKTKCTSLSNRDNYSLQCTGKYIIGSITNDIVQTSHPTPTSRQVVSTIAQ